MFGLSNVSVSAFLAVEAALFLIFNIAVFIWFKFFNTDRADESRELEEKFCEDEELPF